MPEDSSILERVSALVDEEHRLRQALADQQVGGPEERARIQEIEQELDQCWDLLRQRRARVGAAQDPDDASVRSVGTVEGYRQ